MGLLSQFKQDDVDIYGLMSSYPASCMAAAKAFGSKHKHLQPSIT